MKEIGGYIEMSKGREIEYHKNAIALNSGRSCIEYLIRAKKIKKMFIPYFLCSSIRGLCEKCGCEYELYNILRDFTPDLNVVPKENEYILVINYYGQITEKTIDDIKTKYQNIIVDNTQDFFRMPQDNTDTIYSCRKFFGVPDGAYLYSNSFIDDEVETDISYQKMQFLMGRLELGAEEFYPEYVKNNSTFAKENMKYMSVLTHTLLGNEDYNFVKNKRTENFEFLHSKLENKNKLKLIVPNGPFMYPLLLENGEAVKRKLIEKKIFVPTLWPAVFDVCKDESVESYYSKNIVPLPIDQRYGIEEMKYILEVLRNVLSKRN